MVLTHVACGPRARATGGFVFGAAIAALLATFGVLLAMAGAASLLGRPPALGELNATPLGSAIILAVGLFRVVTGRLALAPLPPSRPPIPGAGHGSAPDEKKHD
nr:hypothetical protein GCM10020185_56470 [Pseudomonas brassicacearum subsp. brassicacearum]